MEIEGLKEIIRKYERDLDEKTCSENAKKLQEWVVALLFTRDLDACKKENQKLESDIKGKEKDIEELMTKERKYKGDLDGCINEKTCSEKAKKLQEEKNEWVELLFTILIISIVFNRQQTVPFILRIFFLILSPNTLHNTQTNTARNTANQS